MLPTINLMKEVLYQRRQLSIVGTLSLLRSLLSNLLEIVLKHSKITVKLIKLMYQVLSIKFILAFLIMKVMK